jgi:hypothetical protein
MKATFCSWRRNYFIHEFDAQNITESAQTRWKLRFQREDRPCALRKAVHGLLCFEDGSIFHTLKHPAHNISVARQSGLHFLGDMVLTVSEKHIESVARSEWFLDIPWANRGRKTNLLRMLGDKHLQPLVLQSLL